MATKAPAALSARITTAIDAQFTFDAAEKDLGAACIALFKPLTNRKALMAARQLAVPLYEERYKARAGRTFNADQCKAAFDTFWSRAMKRAEALGWVRPKAETKAAAKKATARAAQKAAAPAKVDGRTLRTKAAGNTGKAAPDPIIASSEGDAFKAALAWVMASEEHKTAFVAWVEAQKAATRTVKAA